MRSNTFIFKEHQYIYFSNISKADSNFRTLKPNILRVRHGGAGHSGARRRQSPASDCRGSSCEDAGDAGALKTPVREPRSSAAREDPAREARGMQRRVAAQRDARRRTGPAVRRLFFS